MRWAAKTIFALLPSPVFYALHGIGWWLYTHYDCDGGIKDLQPCMAHGFDIAALTESLIFWGALLAFLFIPISIWLVCDIHIKYVNQLPHDERGGE